MALTLSSIVIDLVVLSVIILFQDVRGWKLRKIVRGLEQTQKGNSYKSNRDYRQVPGL